MKLQTLWLLPILLASAVGLQACSEEVDCPSFWVAALVQQGETANVLFVLQMPPQITRIEGPFDYAWSISAGEIVSGQFTPSIRVLAPSGSVTETLEIRGFPKECQGFASVSHAVL